MNWKKIINLSPLVDVLMIVIFWYIMMSNQTIAANQESAEDEMNAIRAEYEAALETAEQKNESLIEQVEKLAAETETLADENEALQEEMEVFRQVNDDLSDQMQTLREENESLGAMLEKSVGYVYIHLYDGLNTNRVVEVTYETELVDKFIFTDGEKNYLGQKIENVVTEYANRDEKQRIAVIFLYDGSNALYVDITQIMNVLYDLRSELKISVHTINMAE